MSNHDTGTVPIHRWVGKRKAQNLNVVRFVCAFIPHTNAKDCVTVAQIPSDVYPLKCQDNNNTGGE